MTTSSSENALSGRAAVVTGGGRGLGRAIALALARAGADVAIVGRNPSALATVADEIVALGRRSATIVADISTPGDPDRAIEHALGEFGHLDVLVNNSGITHVGPALDTSDEDIARILGTNVVGSFACIRAAGHHFAAQGSGKVVNVASNLGIVGRSQFVAYCASKAAIIGMTKALALEWARFGIQVNAIAPGLIETDMNASLRANPEATAHVISRVPARRMAHSSEVAPLVVYLASSAADYITGETIVIDGGEVAG